VLDFWIDPRLRGDDRQNASIPQGPTYYKFDNIWHKMKSKLKKFSNFSRAINTSSICVRPDDECQLEEMLVANNSNLILARGNGLSYSDCCVNDNETIIDTSRLNHIISFDPKTSIAVCQGGVTFKDLFLLDSDFIPPVIPGTLKATLAGGIANDVHGKNNHKEGSLGDHIIWIELQISNKSIICSKSVNKELFKATIGGLGLTGVIKRIAIKLKKAPPFVLKKSIKFTNIKDLLKYMQVEGVKEDYQVAWLDLINKTRAILTVASHIKHEKQDSSIIPKNKFSIPKFSPRLINKYLMKQFNRAYFHNIKPDEKIISLQEYNNPLDKINNWNYLYGKNGLLQFQAIFNEDNAIDIISNLLNLINKHKAIPTLSVLKYFTKEGLGLLSFPKKGFTLAIDFINNKEGKTAITAMNELININGGRIYLAKDLNLTRDQFIIMYPQHKEFCDILAHYHSPMGSMLGKRLRLL